MRHHPIQVRRLGERSPKLARFWTGALGWEILSEREREIVIGSDASALVGMCFMPVTDVKTVKNRVHLDLTTSAADPGL